MAVVQSVIPYVRLCCAQDPAANCRRVEVFRVRRAGPRPTSSGAGAKKQQPVGRLNAASGREM
jgi:hypothetical protein